MLIIGCGNLQRGDDAAGVLAAQQLLALGIPAEVSSGETADLIEAWSGAQNVVLVDAVVTGAPVGTIHRWDAASLIASVTTVRSTHGLGVGEAVELARAMDCLPPRLRVYGIEGESFELGAAVSEEVKRAVAEVVQRIAVEMQAGLKDLSS